MALPSVWLRVGWVGLAPTLILGLALTLLMFGWKSWIGLTPTHFYVWMEGLDGRDGDRLHSVATPFRGPHMSSSCSFLLRRRRHREARRPAAPARRPPAPPPRPMPPPPPARALTPLASPCRRALHRPPSPLLTRWPDPRAPPPAAADSHAPRPPPPLELRARRLREARRAAWGGAMVGEGGVGRRDGRRGRHRSLRSPPPGLAATAAPAGSHRRRSKRPLPPGPVPASGLAASVPRILHRPSSQSPSVSVIGRREKWVRCRRFAPSVVFRGIDRTRILEEYSFTEPIQPTSIASKQLWGWVQPNPPRSNPQPNTRFVFPFHPRSE